MTTMSLPLPNTMKGMQVKRMDRLETKHQWILKLASVIGGQWIELRLLRHLIEDEVRVRVRG